MQERERKEDEALGAARKAAKAAVEAFSAVRQRRYDAFRAAFDSVAEAIDGIFKELTRRRARCPDNGSGLGVVTCRGAFGVCLVASGAHQARARSAGQTMLLKPRGCDA